jgi:hypothetical protein
MTFGTMKAVRSSPLRIGRLYPQKYPGTHFLEAESTPGHIIPSVTTEEIPSDTTGDRSRDPPTSLLVDDNFVSEFKDFEIVLIQKAYYMQMSFDLTNAHE